MNDNRNSEPNNLNDYEMLEFFFIEGRSRTSDWQ